MCLNKSLVDEKGLDSQQRCIDQHPGKWSAMIHLHDIEPAS
jgi:hypothetical protein